MSSMAKPGKNKDVYSRLAKHLDDLPGGFPPTESGVELRILRRLFSPEEAELALHLTLIMEEGASIARRAGIPLDEAEKRLADMARKGQIYSSRKKGEPPKYMAAQYVIGIWEYQVDNLDRQLVRDMEEYIPTLLDFDTWSRAPQLRTVPVGKSIPVEYKVMPYEKAEEMVSRHKRFAVAPCICRKEQKLVGKGCDRAEESCLIMGGGADYYAEQGKGRYITKEEALELLFKAEKEGLVLQPSNAKKISNICMCCGCCCAVLRTVKRHPKPADVISSAFVAQQDQDSCIACEICLDRCPMDALTLQDGIVSLNRDRCIGCGLCVSTCPTGGLNLVRKPEDRQKEVPENLMRAYINLAKVRGKFKVWKLAKIWMSSRKKIKAS
jgi:electron transport complex protein RnfB